MKRTYANAVSFAQSTIRQKMASEGRSTPNASDTAELRALIARLMLHVPADQGGVMGLDNAGRSRWRSPHITIAEVEAQAWTPGVWPEDERAAA